METDSQGWHSSRIIHLHGGMRAINIDGPEFRVSPNALHGQSTQLKTRSYPAIYDDLHQLGFSIIGVDFYSHISEVQGEASPNWRTFNKSLGTPWIQEETAHLWKGIAHSAFQQKKGHFWDLASRIGNQLRVCSWRIRQLSESYSQQLEAKSLKKEVQPGQRYVDGYTWITYLAVQSCLVDACILRDYLSEFAAAFIFSERYKLDARRISTLSGLIKHVLSNGEIHDSLAEELRTATQDNGWLKTLGAYRDLVVHSAPLAHAEKRLYAVTDVLQIDAQVAVPFIIIPLPNNPAAISSKRASRDHFDDFDIQFEEYLEAVRGDHPTTDALIYIAQVQENLAKLANTISKLSPIPYQDIVIQKEDIIGPVKIT